MRPAAVGFAAGSDVQAIGDGDFLFAEGADTPEIYINVAYGDTVSVVVVPLSGVGEASVYNASISDGSRDITFAMGNGAFDGVSFSEITNGRLGISFDDITTYLADAGCYAIAVVNKDVFCGRILAFNSSHTIEDAKSIPLPVLLNGYWTTTSGVEQPRTSYVHCEESTVQDPLAWLDFPGSYPDQLMTAAHIEIFMFNAEPSMLTITTEGGPDVNTYKRRYGLVVDVEPDGDEPFALSSSKLFGADPAWWCQLTEI